jgi:predicted Zn-ribbon and HTH transcriptional regulator
LNETSSVGATSFLENGTTKTIKVRSLSKIIPLNDLCDGKLSYNPDVMFRKDLIDMLMGNQMTVTAIARVVDEPPSRIADDLQHLLRSLQHMDYKALIDPAKCRACGFEFSPEKLTKPSKCPECRGTWILEPKIEIQRKSENRKEN